VFHHVDAEDFRDGNGIGLSADCWSRGVLLRKVLSEPVLSARTLAFSAASSLVFSTVADDPDAFASVFSEVQSWWFGMTRHFSLISRIAAGVVYRFLPIRSTVRFPRLISARKALTEMIPRRTSLLASPG
jgi:hypothetical protein